MKDDTSPAAMIKFIEYLFATYCRQDKDDLINHVEIMRAIQSYIKVSESQLTSSNAKIERLREALTWARLNIIERRGETHSIIEKALSDTPPEPDKIGSASFALNATLETISGCSNGGCKVFPPKGQHTNGPCHCLENRLKAERVVHAYKMFAKSMGYEVTK